jgi:hypothetical protein
MKLHGQVIVAGVQALERARLPSPASSDEVRSAMQWWTYRNDKAREQLGFVPRPHEETLEDTVRWQLEQLGDGGHHQLSDAALRGAGAALRLPGRLSPFGRS